jgi:hypothetical protein
MDDEFDWDAIRVEARDLDGYWCDATGDPQVDVAGFRSPSRRGQNLTGFTPSDDHRAADALAKSKRHREERAAKRREPRRATAKTPPEVGSEEWRARRAARWEALGWLTPANESSGEERHEQESQPVQQPVQTPQQQRDEIARKSLSELQPGQHGAFFEKRMVRPWYAPWKKVVRWQQISTWQHTTPPTTGEVVTVGDVSELPGRVHTIGTVSPSGAVEY